MSAVAIGMNLLLAGLLVAAMVVGVRLNARLKALRESHEGFARAVAELDAAAARAEQGLADLRAATDEAHDALADRIEKARALSAKLDRQLKAAPPAARTEQPVSESDVERVTQRLGSLLSGARERRPERDVGPKRAPVPKARPTLDDELFDPPAETPPARTEPAPPRSAAARLGYRR